MDLRERDIIDGLCRIRAQVRSGDARRALLWVLPQLLACSQRPLRDDPSFGGRRPLPPEARELVVRWVERLREEGVRSIICLLECRQLDRYYVSGGLTLHSDGLLGYYRSVGFEVLHVPLTDYKRPPAWLQEVLLRAFHQLPKPVLIHCSAGIDRTAPVAAFIAAKVEEEAPDPR